MLPLYALQIDKYLAKKKAAALRKQHQVYDEFSPGPVSDTSSYQTIEGKYNFKYMFKKI